MEDSTEDDLQRNDESSDSDSQIPLLLDTDGLEAIDSPATAAGELPDIIFGDEQP